MKFQKKAYILVLFALFATHFPVEAQLVLTARDDVFSVGPRQKATKISILANDDLTCSDPTVNLLTILTPSQGTAELDASNNVVFTPAVFPHIQVPIVEINYELGCPGSGNTVTAKLTITVTPFNNPVNVVDNSECMMLMPRNIEFGIHEKFNTYKTFSNYTNDATYIAGSAGDCIDGMTSPLVADLNGDGKPEIIMMGTSYTLRTGAALPINYLNVYNGQTGNRKIKFSLSNFPDVTINGTNSSQYIGFHTGTLNYYFTTLAGYTYHRGVSPIAIADLDNDGMAEIVVTLINGRVFALKPVFDGENITGFNKIWDAKDQNDNFVSYSAPVNRSNDAEYRYLYGQACPIIVDLNGDGIPEVIVYNKVFNGRNGKLLMAWGREADATKQKSDWLSNNPNWGKSVLSGTYALNNLEYADNTTKVNATNTKGSAMTGRRGGTDPLSDLYMAQPAIVDIDGDGIMEIITGTRIHKIQIESLSDHTQNTYTTIEGPDSIIVHTDPANNSTTKNFYLSDGFTQVVDVDGDGELDVVVFNQIEPALSPTVLVYVYDPKTSVVKAAITYRSNGANGNHGIPMIGDINGEMDGWDGLAYTRKIPEICIISGAVYTERSTANNGRTGIGIHPKSDASAFTGKFNRVYSATLSGHIIGLTYDGQATAIEERLKISWAMEHLDRSQATGITLFDFDNNNTMDLCYRDETTVRVISPARGTGTNRYYVTYNQTPENNNSIMFRTGCYSGTGFEYPTIADVNLDGSADIVVTQTDYAGSNVVSASYASGIIRVFEYVGEKWAAAPPVWNQGYYNPLFINEDLTVPARPISPLTQYHNYFTPAPDYMTPYNGTYKQVPIVKKDAPFDPVVRLPDATITDMKVKVFNPTTVTEYVQVTLTIRNRGVASIAEGTPMVFYDGGQYPGRLTFDAAHPYPIDTLLVGVDIFPGEIVTRTYTLPHRDVARLTPIPPLTEKTFNENLIWVRISDDGSALFPAKNFEDCDDTNNTFSGVDCPYLGVKAIPYPSPEICGAGGYTKIQIVDTTALPHTFPRYTPTYQWYKNDVLVSGENTSEMLLFTNGAGIYKCFVTDGICRMMTNEVEITVGSGTIAKAHITATPAGGYFCDPPGIITLALGNPEDYSSSATFQWYFNSVIKTGETNDTLLAVGSSGGAGLYYLEVLDGGCMTIDTFRLINSTHQAPYVHDLATPDAICTGTLLALPAPPTVDPHGSPITESGWLISKTPGSDSYEIFLPLMPLTIYDSGKRLRYYVVNDCGISYSQNIVEIDVRNCFIPVNKNLRIQYKRVVP
jgi:hypothetical protein